MIPTTPEFIRLPSDEKAICPHTGLKRHMLRRLCVPCEDNNHRPAVPAKHMIEPGKARGIWLLPLKALTAHLHALPTTGLKVEPRTQVKYKLKTASPVSTHAQS